MRRGTFISQPLSVSRETPRKGAKKKNVQHPSLGSLARRVPDRVHDPGREPRGAQRRGGHGEAQARAEEGHEEGGEVLCEVGVGTLGCVVCDVTFVY